MTSHNHPNPGGRSQYEELDDRLTSVEQTQIRMVTQLETMNSTLGAMSSSVQLLAREFNDSRRPDTKMLLTAAGLLIVIATLTLTPIYQRIKQSEEDLLKLDNTAVHRNELMALIKERDRYADLQQKYLDAKFSAYQRK